MIGQLLTERYLVVKTLGSGGFSETYLARDKYLPQHPLCVVKFLKLSPSSTISRDTAQRLFDTEARILGELGQQHSQIPMLFAYCQQQDQVYQVQEYIDGENLSGWLARKRCLSPQGAIELLSNLLPVLDHIHAHQIIHRDIKPSNLIRRRDDGKVVMIDFGAADYLCELESGDSGSHLEEALLAIGTPRYMPDEQKAGKACFSSDLYALGMTIIHLLTGIAPKLQYDSITGGLEWQTQLREPIDAKLAAILDRLVQRHPRDRFQRASDVLSALEALPAAKPESLQPWSVPAWQQSARQFASSLKQQALKPVVLVLLATLAGGGYFLDRGQSVGMLVDQVGALTHRSDVQLTLLHDLPVQSAIDQMLISPNSRVLVTAGADRVLRLWSLPAGRMLKALPGNTDTVTALSMSRDSRLLVSGSADRSVRLWNVASGELLRKFDGNREAITAVAISPDGSTIASGSRDGTLYLWDLHTGALLKTLSVPAAEVTAVAYGATSLISASATSAQPANPSANQPAAQPASSQIQVWDLASGQLRRTFAGHTEAIVGLQVVDQTLLSFGEDQTLMWDLQREELVQAFADEAAQPIASMLDGQHLITVYDSGSVQIWTRKTGWLATTISSQWRNLEATLSPNQRYLACWSADRRLRLWQVAALR